jgi:hypothetical protein
MCEPHPRPNQAPCLLATQAGDDETSRLFSRAPYEMRLGQPASVSSARSRYVYSIILNKFLHIARHTFLQFGLPL